MNTELKIFKNKLNVNIFEYEFIFLCRQQDLIETNLINVINKLKIKKKLLKLKIILLVL